MVSVIVLWQRTNYVVDRYIQLCTFTDSIELYNFYLLFLFHINFLPFLRPLGIHSMSTTRTQALVLAVVKGHVLVSD